MGEKVRVAARSGSGRPETGNRRTDGMSGVDGGKPAADLQSVTPEKISTNNDHHCEVTDPPVLQRSHTFTATFLTCKVPSSSGFSAELW